jgi:hypothetical protein
MRSERKRDKRVSNQAGRRHRWGPDEPLARSSSQVPDRGRAAKLHPAALVFPLEGALVHKRGWTCSTSEPPSNKQRWSPLGPQMVAVPDWQSVPGLELLPFHPIFEISLTQGSPSGNPRVALTLNFQQTSTTHGAQQIDSQSSIPESLPTYWACNL